jgi:hypothetical protein
MDPRALPDPVGAPAGLSGWSPRSRPADSVPAVRDWRSISGKW